MPGKGRAVRVAEPIADGTVLEEAPVIVMHAADRILLDQTLLHDYIFEWNPDGTRGCCMALGWVPLFNHSYQSNCEYFMDFDTGLIAIKTVRLIKKGEEVTINYNGDWNDAAKLWFDAE